MAYEKTKELIAAIESFRTTEARNYLGSLIDKGLSESYHYTDYIEAERRENEALARQEEKREKRESITR